MDNYTVERKSKAGKTTKKPFEVLADAMVEYQNRDGDNDAVLVELIDRQDKKPRVLKSRKKD